MQKRQRSKGRRGRPALGRLRTNLALDPDVRSALEREAERRGESLADAANRVLRAALPRPR